LRLIRDDSIFEAAREQWIKSAYWMANRDKQSDEYTWTEWAKLDRDPPKLAQVLSCPWCLGVWCGFAVLVLRSNRAGRSLRDALAMSWAASMAEIHIVKPDEGLHG
jgi:hypothetical protein